MTWRDFEARLVLKAWQDEAFRQALLRDPKAVLERETGTKLPDRVQVKVLEETPHRLGNPRAGGGRERRVAIDIYAQRQEPPHEGELLPE